MLRLTVGQDHQKCKETSNLDMIRDTSDPLVDKQQESEYRKVPSTSTSRLVTCLGLYHPQGLDFLYSNMSRLEAPHVTNRIYITFEIQAKKDEIHAKKTYEIQRRMLKSKQRRMLKSKQGRI